MRRPQIAVVGSASGSPELLATAHELGRALVDAGWRIVCGGLTGVMQAASEGAHVSQHATGADVIGVLPSLDAAAANPYVDIVIPTGMNQARNLIVVASADVVVAVGGGAGTLSEIALAWQLRRPVVAITSQGGWAQELAGRTLDRRQTQPILAAESVPEAVAAVRELLTTGTETAHMIGGPRGAADA